MTPYDVPLIDQPSAQLCAVACGAMMWAWRSSEKGASVGSFQAAAGAALQKGGGLNGDQMAELYGKLGLRQLGGLRSVVPSLKKATGANVRYALKWSPVIVLIDPVEGQEVGHIAVVRGHTGSHYLMADPNGYQGLDFSTPAGGSNQAAYTEMLTGVLDRRLGPIIWYW